MRFVPPPHLPLPDQTFSRRPMFHPGRVALYLIGAAALLYLVIGSVSL